MIIACVDTETTGLTIHSRASLVKQPHIVEYACAQVENGKIIATYETLIKPPVGVSDEITKITGLTDDDLKDARTFQQALPVIEASLAGCDVLLAHNLPFDLSMLRFELARIGIEIKLPEVMVCTAQLYHDEYGKRVRMQELYELKLGKPLHQTHRAMDDAMALAEIVIAEQLWKVL